MATFLLVPGAWHGAWCWEYLVPLLQGMGHHVLTPELVGMGEDRGRAATGGLAVWADQVAGIVSAQDGPVILAGHSRGGTIISEVAERVPDRIAALVYIAALLLPDDVSIQQQLATVTDRAATGILPAPDGTCTVAPEDVGPVFYTTTAPERAARAVSLVGPEPMASLATAVHVTQERFGTVPRAYIECSVDLAIPLDAQRAMQAVWPCDPVVTLDCDHSPFYSEPEALARTLHQISEKDFTR
ncbi:MAG: alpha/beta fold hydrolase [Sphingobium sp.]